VEIVLCQNRAVILLAFCRSDVISPWKLWTQLRTIKTYGKIIIGLAFIIGGLSGKLVLIGTQSGAALAVVGDIMLAWGIFNIAKARQAK
jgi:hypothetical protein